MAKGLIIDDDYGRLARAYYQRFGTEPVDATIGIAVDSPSHIPHTSLDTTLQAIIDAFGKRCTLYRVPRVRIPPSPVFFPRKALQDLFYARLRQSSFLLLLFRKITHIGAPK